MRYPGAGRPMRSPRSRVLSDAGGRAVCCLWPVGPFDPKDSTDGPGSRMVGDGSGAIGVAGGLTFADDEGQGGCDVSWPRHYRDGPTWLIHQQPNPPSRCRWRSWRPISRLGTT
ncbi:hypothetical protein BN381_80409 [Candidatus Microthrix parvicella RN1]|uniref:Uncharacterized protein n=1 Tax=Candidatus Neomicrothrix parvicella RN1 TaxID=1229780 RepID=R4Z4Q2_9ACTN|nr:hypothetical protein BN381_80409 [Candidatus Microthrix parvicella RN1]